VSDDDDVPFLSQAANIVPDPTPAVAASDEWLTSKLLNRALFVEPTRKPPIAGDMQPSDTDVLSEDFSPMANCMAGFCPAGLTMPREWWFDLSAFRFASVHPPSRLCPVLRRSTRAEHPESTTLVVLALSKCWN
jgi:hypothetical protein